MNWLTDAKVTTREQKVTDKSLNAQERLTVEFRNSADLSVSYMGHTFQADKDSRALLAETLSVGKIPAGFYWLDIDNAEVLMTLPELKGLAATMLSSGFDRFKTLQTNKQRLRAATNEAEVDTIMKEINPEVTK